MRRLVAAFIATVSCTWLAPHDARAGFADTPGKGTFVLDVSYQEPWVRQNFDGRGRTTNLNEDIVMYDPAGTPLGVISVPARHYDKVLLTQAFYGFTDAFAAGVVIPYFLESKTKLNLQWTPGAYASDLGRPYSEEDFWRFAGSMGQGKPGDFRAGKRLGDIVLGGLYQIQKGKRYQTAVMGFVNTRTGEPANPEILGSSGTTGFELQSNGDAGMHAMGDYRLNPRISVGGELFYEWFGPRRLASARGTVNPLLSYEGRYNGGGYLVVPGDWLGGMAGASFTLLRGTDATSWITKNNPKLQKSLPPLLTAEPRLKYTRFFGNRYRSGSPYFDYVNNEANPNGFRVNVEFKASLNALRYGAPVALNYSYVNQELIAGRNFFPITSHVVGLQLFAAF